jgi:hypothetical protein
MVLVCVVRASVFQWCTDQEFHATCVGGGGPSTIKTSNWSLGHSIQHVLEEEAHTSFEFFTDLLQQLLDN